jgi:hypothetical protein
MLSAAAYDASELAIISALLSEIFRGVTGWEKERSVSDPRGFYSRIKSCSHKNAVSAKVAQPLNGVGSAGCSRAALRNIIPGQVESVQLRSIPQCKQGDQEDVLTIIFNYLKYASWEPTSTRQSRTHKHEPILLYYTYFIIGYAKAMQR